MSVDFEDENKFNESFNRSNSTSGYSSMTSWIIKKGFAKDKKGVDKILIVIIIVCFAVAIYFRIK